MAASNLLGQKFNRLLVLERTSNKGTHAVWICQCDCGTIRDVLAHNLKSGRHKSCGCLAKENRHKHGHNTAGVTTGEYRSWKNAKKRCYYPNDDYYSYYGGRGITMCDRWRNSYTDFYADMGDKPSPEYSLDRIDTNGNYEPGNCKWSTSSEQSKNQRIRKDNTSGYKGVSWTKRDGKWQAYIKPYKDRGNIHLGFYIHKMDAVRARIEAEILYGFTVQEV